MWDFYRRECSRLLQHLWALKLWRIIWILPLLSGTICESHSSHCPSFYCIHSVGGGERTEIQYKRHWGLIHCIPISCPSFIPHSVLRKGRNQLEYCLKRKRDLEALSNCNLWKSKALKQTYYSQNSFMSKSNPHAFLAELSLWQTCSFPPKPHMSRATPPN